MEKTYEDDDPNVPDIYSAESGSYDAVYYSEKVKSDQKWYKRAVDSFKRPDTYDFNTDGMSKGEIAMNLMARSKPPLSKRHLMIIAASSCVGTGLFIGSGSSLTTGGPAALLIGFGVMAVGMICTMASVGEIAVRYPSTSPFYELPAKFLDPSYGYATGVLYLVAWGVTVPLELIAGAELTQFWHNDNNPGAKVNPVAWVSLFYVFTVCLNLVGTRAYGEFEFLVGAIKVLAVIAFIIFAIVINCGGGPNGHYIGGEYWHNPPDKSAKFSHGFANSFKGVIQVMVSCSFAYGGTEVSAIAAAETANPVKAIPSAVRQCFWRVTIFFIVGTTMVGLTVPYTAQIGYTADGGSPSPFVVALKYSHVHAVPTLFNCVIMLSVLGVANAAVYASTRTLTSLAVNGAAPSIFCYIDRRGRPLVSLATTLGFALLCFVCASDQYNAVFNWLYSTAALAFLYAWFGVCASHIMMRWAMRVQGVSMDELVFKSPLGIPGAVLGAGIMVFVYSLQFWIYIWPFGRDQMSPNSRAAYYFQNDLSVPIFIVAFVGHKLFYRTKFMTPSTIKLNEGVRQIDYEQLRLDLERETQLMKKNPLRRIAAYIC